MPQRTLALVRRGINRLADLIERTPDVPALAAIARPVDQVAQRTNAAVFVVAPAAAENIRELPAGGGTVDDICGWARICSS